MTLSDILRDRMAAQTERQPTIGAATGPDYFGSVDPLTEYGGAVEESYNPLEDLAPIGGVRRLLGLGGAALGFGTIPAWKLTKNAPSWLQRAFTSGKREVPLQSATPRRVPIQDSGLVKNPVTYELPSSADELAPLLEQIGGSYGPRKMPPVSGGVDMPIKRLTKEQKKLQHDQVMRGYRILMGEEQGPVSTPQLIEPGFAPYLKRQTDLMGFSHDLQALRDSPVRELGFAKSSQQASYAYLTKLRRLVEQKAPDKLKLVDDAIDAVMNDDFANAAMRSEQAVGYLHMDERAEIRDLKELGKRTLKLGKEISGGAPSMFEKVKAMPGNLPASEGPPKAFLNRLIEFMRRKQ